MTINNSQYFCLLYLPESMYLHIEIFRLYIKQASSAISIVDEEDSEPEWMEYKIKETNMFTVDKYQQVH